MSDPSVETVDIQLNFTIAGQPIAAKIMMPKGPVRQRVMLPLFQNLTDMLVDIGKQQTAKSGKTISCAKGCAACCRGMLITLTEVEAWSLAEMVNAMEPARRAEVLRKFDSVCQQLEHQGMLGQMEQPENMSEADRQRLTLKYVSLGIPCPFLEDESCSIYADRPMVCREHLVTSPAQRCASGVDKIERVPVPSSMATAVASLGSQPGERTKWVPLITAPQWVAAHPEPAPTQTGSEMFREALEWL